MDNAISMSLHDIDFGHLTAVKRAGLSNHEQSILPEDRLRAMGKDDLIAHMLKLQTQITHVAEKQASLSLPPTTPPLSKEDLDRKVSKARAIMEKGITSQMKFEPAEFHDMTRTELSTSIRYGYLNVTGNKVTVRWDAKDLTFTVTGSYGL
ncbi:MAG: hypothetical protein Q9210_005803 [Variospora velana]